MTRLGVFSGNNSPEFVANPSGIPAKKCTDGPVSEKVKAHRAPQKERAGALRHPPVNVAPCFVYDGIAAHEVQCPAGATGPLRILQAPHAAPPSGGIYSWQLSHRLSGMSVSSTYCSAFRICFS